MNGLLLCDVPAKPVLEKYGDYSVIFNSTFKVNGGFKSFKVYEGEYPQNLNDYKVFVLTGASAYENKEWIHKLIQFLQRIHSTTNIRIVGICFGFQILSMALGGKVDKNSLGCKREVGPTILNCNSQGKDVLKVNELRIQSMHQDIVQELPLDWINLAESDKCQAQFAIYKDRYLCFQGHPEYTRDMVQEIVNVRQHLFSKDLYNLEISVDSEILIRLVVDFINKSHS